MQLSEIFKRIILNDSVFIENGRAYAYSEPLSNIYILKIRNPIDVVMIYWQAIFKKRNIENSSFSRILAFYFNMRFCFFYCIVLRIFQAIYIFIKKL